MDLPSLSFPGLTETRLQVAAALAELSAGPQARTVLKVGPSAAAEVTHNLRLACAPAVPAAQLYTGVLYDALDVAGLSPAGKRRANRWVVVVSALYGALRLQDKVAPYRLAMDRTLPGLPKMSQIWRGPLEEALSPEVGRGVVVDCRSAAYVAALPAPRELAARWVQIQVRGVSHHAKHTRGLVARALCEKGVDAADPTELAVALAQDFDVELLAPPREGKPWTLSVHPPTGQRRSASQV